MISGVILAGGLARRMGGGDKPLVSVAGQPLLRHVIDRLSPQVDALAINANGDPARFAGFGLPVIADTIDDHPGPLAGVLAGMDWAGAQGHEAIVTVAGDTPFFPADLVSRLRAVAAPLACAASGGRVHPVIGYWPVALADDLRAALMEGTRKVDRWTARHGIASAEWPAEPYDPFFNINRPEDRAEAERIARA